MLGIFATELNAVIRGLLGKALMLIVMAVQTQELPVVAIGGIKIMVMIFVMHRELAQIGVVKAATTASTNPGVEFKGLLSVAMASLFAIFACLGYDLIEFGLVYGVFFCGHEVVTNLG